jgi:hypothetical protein
MSARFAAEAKGVRPERTQLVTKQAPASRLAASILTRGNVRN